MGDEDNPVEKKFEKEMEECRAGRPHSAELAIAEAAAKKANEEGETGSFSGMEISSLDNLRLRVQEIYDVIRNGRLVAIKEIKNGFLVENVEGEDQIFTRSLRSIAMAFLRLSSEVEDG